MSKITRERLMELLSYDKESGNFVWIVDKHCGRKKGNIAGCMNRSHRNPYVLIRVDRELLLAHRLAWLYTYGVFPDGFIDHINGDGFDNRIANLRDVTNAQNMQATRIVPKHNTSGFRGVSPSKSGRRWIAGISIGDKRFHIGTFDTKEDAHAAYICAKDRNHFV